MNVLQIIYVVFGIVLATIIYTRGCINDLKDCKAYLEYNMTSTRYVNYHLNIFWMIILAPLIVMLAGLMWPGVMALVFLANSEDLKEKIRQFLLRRNCDRELAKNARLLKRKEVLKAKLASQILANETHYRIAAVGHEILDNPSKLQEISFLDADTVGEYCTLCSKLT